MPFFFVAEASQDGVSLATKAAEIVNMPPAFRPRRPFGYHRSGRSRCGRETITIANAVRAEANGSGTYLYGVNDVQVGSFSDGLVDYAIPADSASRPPRSRRRDDSPVQLHLAAGSPGRLGSLAGIIRRAPQPRRPTSTA